METKEKIEKVRGLLKEVEEISKDLIENDNAELVFTLSTDQKTVSAKATTIIEVTVAGQLKQEF